MVPYHKKIIFDFRGAYLLYRNKKYRGIVHKVQPTIFCLGQSEDALYKSKITPCSGKPSYDHHNRYQSWLHMGRTYSPQSKVVGMQPQYESKGVTTHQQAR